MMPLLTRCQISLRLVAPESSCRTVCLLFLSHHLPILAKAIRRELFRLAHPVVLGTIAVYFSDSFCWVKHILDMAKRARSSDV